MDESALPLPGRCTGIVAQKKKKNRVSLFIEDTFLDGFYRDVIDKSGINTGDIVTGEQYRKIVRAERIYHISNQIYRWLAVRNHSSSEIIKKCLAKGYTKEEAQDALNPIIEKGYLDDALFAKSYASDKKELHGWGPAKIRMSLAQKGLKKQYIDDALEDLFTDQQLIESMEAATRSVAKRLLRTVPGLKRKKKLVDFLIRRGFPGYIVIEKCDALLTKLENEEL